MADELGKPWVESKAAQLVVGKVELRAASMAVELVRQMVGNSVVHWADKKASHSADLLDMWRADESAAMRGNS
jgi:hypothetical protein